MTWFISLSSSQIVWKYVRNNIQSGIHPGSLIFVFWLLSLVITFLKVVFVLLMQLSSSFLVLLHSISLWVIWPVALLPKSSSTNQQHWHHLEDLYEMQNLEVVPDLQNQTLHCSQLRWFVCVLKFENHLFNSSMLPTSYLISNPDDLPRYWSLPCTKASTD